MHRSIWAAYDTLHDAVTSPCRQHDCLRGRLRMHPLQHRVCPYLYDTPRLRRSSRPHLAHFIVALTVMLSPKFRAQSLDILSMDTRVQFAVSVAGTRGRYEGAHPGPRELQRELGFSRRARPHHARREDTMLQHLTNT